MMRMELAACEATLLREIADQGTKRKSVALTYALALRSSEREGIDWKKVNRAIVERWCRSGLSWIKRRAWALAEGKVQP